MKLGMLAFAAAAGLVIGALITAAYLSSQWRVRKDSLEQKIRCEQIAKQYEHDNSSEIGSTEIDEVVFSPARNSCIAKVIRTGNFWEYAVVDLLSREKGWSEMCNYGTGECANRDDQLLKERDAHFKQFVGSKATR
jgi:hypothetical protein